LLTRTGKIGRIVHDLNEAGLHVSFRLSPLGVPALSGHATICPRRIESITREGLPESCETVSSQVSIANYGVGTTGLNVFDGSVVQSPRNNSGYAQAPASYPGGHANNSDVNNQVLVVNSLVFTFSGLGSTFDETMIKDARFQFGTGLSEPSISVPTGSHQPPFFGPGVPEQSSLAIAGVGALALMGYGVRRRRSG
jgi:hypothetical protein